MHMSVFGPVLSRFQIVCGFRWIIFSIKSQCFLKFSTTFTHIFDDFFVHFRRLFAPNCTGICSRKRTKTSIKIVFSTLECARKCTRNSRVWHRNIRAKARESINFPTVSFAIVSKTLCASFRNSLENTSKNWSSAAIFFSSLICLSNNSTTTDFGINARAGWSVGEHHSRGAHGVWFLKF